MFDFNYSNVVVGVDGSKASDRAFKKAMIIAEHNQARLAVIAVINDRDVLGVNKGASIGFGAVNPTAVENLKVQIQSMVSNYVEIAKDRGLNAVGAIDYGDPREILTSTTLSDYHADALVVGATGAGIVSRLTMGSTAAYVVTHSPVDVFVVRTDQKL